MMLSGGWRRLEAIDGDKDKTTVSQAGGTRVVASIRPTRMRRNVVPRHGVCC